MPHFKSGREAKMFDRVRAPTGARYEKDKPPETIYSDAFVVGIQPGAECCELTILVGSGKCMGSISLPQFAGGEHPPRAGVVLDGYWTNVSASSCELLGPDKELIEFGRQDALREATFVCQHHGHHDAAERLQDLAQKYAKTASAGC